MRDRAEEDATEITLPTPRSVKKKGRRCSRGQS